MQQLRYMDIFLFLNNYVKLLCSFVLLLASQKGRCPLVLFPRGVVRSFIRGGPMTFKALSQPPRSEPMIFKTLSQQSNS